MILGVDAGASHVEIALANRAGTVCDRRSIAPVESVRSDPRGLAGTIARAAADMAPGQQFECVSIGAAGAGAQEVRDEFRLHLEGLFERALVHVTTDIEIAVASCFPRTPGIVLASGTGSFAARRNYDLTVTRSGGHGPSIGDRGSAYDLANRSIQFVVRHAAVETEVGKAVLTATASKDIQTLAAWHRSATRPEIAALARVVCGSAVNGDNLAEEQLSHASDELMKLVLALGLDDEALPVAFAGGLLRTGSPLRTMMEDAVTAAPGFQPDSRIVDSVAGAIAMAVECLSP